MTAFSLFYAPYRAVLRYAIGAALLMAVAMGFDWLLAFLIPVLSISFLAPGGRPPTIKGGIFFIVFVALACSLGLLLAYCFLSMPPIHILITFLLLFHLFYTRHPIFNKMVKLWLLVAILLIPNIALQSKLLAEIMAVSLVWDAVCSLFLIWTIYLLIPLLPHASPSVDNNITQRPTSTSTRFETALTSTLVIMPVFMIFYFVEIPNALLILVFIAILSMQPEFAKDWKVGKALILGNLIGGLVAILGYELLTFVPEYGFLLTLTLATGLIFGQYVFGKSPLAPVFGMAFSTFLLIIGSVTGSDGDGASGKVWSRVIQIVIAVAYVVTAFGLIAKFRSAR